MRIASPLTSFVLAAALSGSWKSAAAFAPSFAGQGTGFARQMHTEPRTRLFSDISTEMRGFVHEEPLGGVRRKRDQKSSLSAVAIESAAPFDFSDGGMSVSSEVGSLWSTIKPVLSTALLVTGNTVGASALVLPEMAARPGMAVSSLLFVGAYVVNLISGLLLAEVAIKQHESSGADVPSSFKEFADENLDIPMAGNLISGISLFVNACIMSFDLTRAGEISSVLLGGLDTSIASLGVAALLAGLVSTQSNKKLSDIASMAVTALFISFGGLLLPGLVSINDPMGAFLTPGTTPDVMDGVAQAAPIILMTMVYQNIVPSVAKILEYDRTKTVAAIALGSLIPCFMFLGWCFATIGGGIDASIALDNPVMMAFSLAAVTGSTIGASMSLSEEFETFVSKKKESSSTAGDHTFSLPAVLASVSLPLAAAYLFAGGEDFTAALQVAGGYGSPLLYGVIPVAMAWTQRERLKANADLVPGGRACLGGLGSAAMAFVGQEFIHDMGSTFAYVN